MAKAKKGTAKAATVENSKGVLTDGGIFVDAKVVTGRKTKLSAKEQGQLARGEIDESGEPTGKEIKRDDVKTIRSSETLYRGTLSAEAISAKTGEEISYRWDQAMPATEEGCYRAFESAHGVGSVKRDTFKLDPDNKIDPTKRTSLERP
jgi:hypothetical protein